MLFGVKRLAITGGIAEGKSTVLGYARDAGFQTLSADEVARSIWREPSVESRIAELLGAASPVSREAALAALASNQRFRTELNRLVHPRITAALLEDPSQIVEVPLLFETCLHPLFQRVWVVSCGADEQMRRLTLRTGDFEASRALLAAQLPTDVKCAFADRIVRTNQEEPSVRAYVLEALSQDFG